MRLLLFSLSSLFIFPIYANDLDLTITNSAGTDITMIQDGQDNDIDLTMNRMNGQCLISVRMLGRQKIGHLKIKRC